jgi:radical SAM superfamily enzyme YgiQ (UPF0313 family)
MLKVLLVQLPFPRWADRNIPLAAGYLKAMANRAGLLDTVQIDIFDKRIVNTASDSMLIDEIVRRQPDVIGFTLYVWNAMRSLFIARQIRKRLPQVKIIAGGPEVTLETGYLLEDVAIDIKCLGEGEATFVEILRSVISKRSSFQHIKGIFYGKGKQFVYTGERTPINEIDSIPSPYLLGILDPCDYGKLFIESRRGCSFRCAYCSQAGSSCRSFSVDRIRRELQLAISKRVSLVEFCDSSFNISTDFNGLCKTIKEVNKEKKLRLYSAITAEKIGHKEALLLKECGFDAVSVGLQSCSPTSLAKVNRSIDLKKFLFGIKCLKERKIGVQVDTIIGLPGETSADIKNTISFLERHRLNTAAGFYVLSVLPGSELRKKADKYGLKYQQYPPYLIQESAALSRQELLEITGGISQWYKRLYYCLNDLLFSYSAGAYPYKKETIDKENRIRIRDINKPLSIVILEGGGGLLNAAKMKQLSLTLSKLVRSPLTVWCKCHNPSKDIGRIAGLMRDTGKRNPFLLYNILFEITRPFPLAALDDLKEEIPHQDHELTVPLGLIETSIRIALICPWRGNRLNQHWLSEVDQKALFLWSIEFKEDNRWKAEIEEIAREESGRGLLIDFHPDVNMTFIKDVLCYLASPEIQKHVQRQNKMIIFRNLMLNMFSQQICDNKRNAILERPIDFDAMAIFDKNLDITSYILPDQKTIADQLQWQLAVQKLYCRP